MKKLLAATALAALLATATVSVFAAPTLTTSQAAALKPPASEHITVYVLPGKMGFVGPDHHHHDTMAPSVFVLWKGVPVTMTVVNYDDGAHAIAAPDLGVVITIKPGTREKKAVDVEPEGKHPHIMPSVTTVTFTPKKAGTFRWFCTHMCDGPSHWSMSAGYDGPAQDGFMAGFFRVL